MNAQGFDRAQFAIGYLRHHIVSGKWPVGTKIPTEIELMELLGVGRTTVREAVRSLATLGMLETAVSRGTFVRSQLPASSVLAEFIAEFGIVDILGFRRALEVEAAQLAALNRTPAQLESLSAAHTKDLSADVDYPTRPERNRTPGQFHAALLDATGNRLMASLYAGVMAGLRSAIDQGEVVYGASADVRHSDHSAILAAVTEGDPIAAAHAAAAHAEHDLIAPRITELAAPSVTHTPTP